jgi:hypothetical protein
MQGIRKDVTMGLKVGTELYYNSFPSMRYAGKVTKITKTQATVQTEWGTVHKLRIPDFDTDFFYEVGDKTKYGKIAYRIITPDEKEKMQVQRRLHGIHSMMSKLAQNRALLFRKLCRFSDEDWQSLEKILNILTANGKESDNAQC